MSEKQTPNRSKIPVPGSLLDELAAHRFIPKYRKGRLVAFIDQHTGCIIPVSPAPRKFALANKAPSDFSAPLNEVSERLDELALLLKIAIPETGLSAKQRQHLSLCSKKTFRDPNKPFTFSRLRRRIKSISELLASFQLPKREWAEEQILVDNESELPTEDGTVPPLFVALDIPRADVLIESAFKPGQYLFLKTLKYFLATVLESVSNEFSEDSPATGVLGIIVDPAEYATWQNLDQYLESESSDIQSAAENLIRSDLPSTIIGPGLEFLRDESVQALEAYVRDRFANIVLIRDDEPAATASDEQFQDESEVQTKAEQIRQPDLEGLKTQVEALSLSQRELLLLHFRLPERQRVSDLEVSTIKAAAHYLTCEETSELVAHIECVQDTTSPFDVHAFPVALNDELKDQLNELRVEARTLMPPEAARATIERLLRHLPKAQLCTQEQTQPLVDNINQFLKDQHLRVDCFDPDCSAECFLALTIPSSVHVHDRNLPTESTHYVFASEHPSTDGPTTTELHGHAAILPQVKVVFSTSDDKVSQSMQAHRIIERFLAAGWGKEKLSKQLGMDRTYVRKTLKEKHRVGEAVWTKLLILAEENGVAIS